MFSTRPLSSKTTHAPHVQQETGKCCPMETEHTSRIWTSDCVGGTLVVVIGLDVIIIGTDGKIGGVSKTGTGIVGKGS